MAVVSLRSPLRELAGGQGKLEVDGTTVGEIIGVLERSYPRLTGWVRDEQGRIRQHVNVFLNGERASLNDAVSRRDRIHVLPAISGGAVQVQELISVPEAPAEEWTELLVGTRKGLFVLHGGRGERMEVQTRKFAGNTVECAMRD